MELPGTYVRCMSGHYYAETRGDEECPICEELVRLRSFKREYDKLKSAVDTIPAAVMLAGGPPYKLTFTEACLREIMESQK